MTGTFTPHHTDHTDHAGHTENGANGGIAGGNRDDGDDPEASDLLTTKDTLALLGIAEQTLRRRRRDGKIAPVPVNPAKRWAQRYYRRVDVERLRRGG